MLGGKETRYARREIFRVWSKTEVAPLERHVRCPQEPTFVGSPSMAEKCQHATLEMEEAIN